MVNKAERVSGMLSMALTMPMRARKPNTLSPPNRLRQVRQDRGSSPRDWLSQRTALRRSHAQRKWVMLIIRIGENRNEKQVSSRVDQRSLPLPPKRLALRLEEWMARAMMRGTNRKTDEDAASMIAGPARVRTLSNARTLPPTKCRMP